jgi:hypothetical protein
MHLDVAKSTITAALARMNALFNKPLFDEWVVVSFETGRDAVLAYQGPRAESFRKEFADDILPLSREMADKRLAVGDFDFAREATSTRFDACIRIGAAGYLLCNNTAKSMAEIRQDPRWIQAQKAFVALSNTFRADPLE